MTGESEPPDPGRWRFRLGSTPSEEARRAAFVTRIDAWWAEFGKKTSDLDRLFRGNADWDLPGWMHRHLSGIHPGLFWEFGRGLRGGHRLVITPESIRSLRPLVEEILARAPRIEGWEFYPYRLAESYEMALRTVEARTSGDISSAVFVLRPGDGNRVDITFGTPRPGDADADFGHYFVATETLLGEELLDKWVGTIEVRPLDELSDPHPIEGLRAETDRVIQSIKNSLPKEECWRLAEEAKWSLFEIEPSSNDEADYPGQTDMMIGSCTNQDLWRTTHSRMPFCSARFSRCGEVFCYVKLDGREGTGEQKFADRSEIADSLDAELAPAGLGCHMGGGTGLWYSYVDLALTDVDRGVEVVRRVLREGNVPRRSWILFFDDEWSREWVGVYDDSPVPPLRS
jgi:hypothetical protein